MLNFVAEWSRQRATVRELSRLSDHELADLGIARSEIRAVVARAADRSSSRPGADRWTLTWADKMAPSWGSHNRRSFVS